MDEKQQQHFEGQVGAFVSGCAVYHEMFTSLRSVGFARFEALYLVGQMVREAWRIGLEQAP